MSEPKRWLDDDRDPARDDVRSLLSLGEAPRALSEAQFARSAARVGSIAAAVSLSLWSKVLLAALAVATVTGGAVLATRRARSGVGAAPSASLAPPRAARHARPTVAALALPVASVSVAAASAPALITPARVDPPATRAPRAPSPPAVRPSAPSLRSPSALAVVPSSTPEPARAPSVAPAGADPSGAPLSDPLADEERLLEPARRSFRTAPAQALLALDAHARAHPSGQLSDEREYLRFEATRRALGDEAARPLALRYLDRYGSSPYARRVRAHVEPGAAP